MHACGRGNDCVQVVYTALQKRQEAFVGDNLTVKRLRKFRCYRSVGYDGRVIFAFLLDNVGPISGMFNTSRFTHNLSLTFFNAIMCLDIQTIVDM